MAEGCKHKSTLLWFLIISLCLSSHCLQYPFQDETPNFVESENRRDEWKSLRAQNQDQWEMERESDAANVSYVRVKWQEWKWISFARRQVATLMSTRALLFVCFNMWGRTRVCGLGIFPALCLILMSCSFVFLWFCRIDRKKDKTERKILDSQERAFWDVHRPVVCEGWTLCGMGCHVWIVFELNRSNRHTEKNEALETPFVVLQLALWKNSRAILKS